MKSPVDNLSEAAAGGRGVLDGSLSFKPQTFSERIAH